MLWMGMTAGRGDDARLMYLPDMMEPKLLRGIGEDFVACLQCICWMLDGRVC